MQRGHKSSPASSSPLMGLAPALTPDPNSFGLL
jgi:hypothetical protein